MLNAERILKSFEDNGISFFTGVPDSQLKALCNCLMNTYGISDKHVIAANEGNAVGLAAGYHMATGKIPCVYLKNSETAQIKAYKHIVSFLDAKGKTGLLYDINKVYEREKERRGL